MTPLKRKLCMSAEAMRMSIKGNVPVMRVRFYVSIEATEEDYRPVVWPIPHPYWCSGETDTHFVLVAYVESEEQLMTQWPEAEQLDVMERSLDHYTFTSRFSKPDWLV